MNLIFRLSFVSVFLAGCATYSPLTDKGGASPERAADGSSSPITEEEAWKIAGRMVSEREGWVEYQPGANGLIDVISYRARRIDNGGWQVMARKGRTDKYRERIVYSQGPSVIVIVSKFGTVTHYERVNESKTPPAGRNKSPISFRVS